MQLDCSIAQRSHVSPGASSPPPCNVASASKISKEAITKQINIIASLGTRTTTKSTLWCQKQISLLKNFKQIPLFILQIPKHAKNLK
jgi:hypothetical protein